MQIETPALVDRRESKDAEDSFTAVGEFYRTIDVQLNGSGRDDFAVVTVKLNRYDGLIACLERSEMAMLRAVVAERIRSVASVNVMIVDLSWGVFAVCLSVARDGRAENLLSRKLHQIFKEPVVLNGQHIFLPVNAGAARFPEHGDDARKLIDAAWLAAHVGGHRAGNQCHFFDQAITDSLKRKRQVEHSLRRALLRLEPQSATSAAREASPFDVVYQPKVDLGTLKISGVEALARWNDPNISAGPDEFIAIAEETGLIVPLGRWIVQRAFHHHQAWRRRGESLRLAINVSPIQLSSLEEPRFPDFLARQILLFGVDPKQIEIEITEGMMMDPVARAAIDELSSAGVSIAIDDFGKLYSNLAILASLPASTLKIDKEFVDDIVNDKRKRIVAEQVVGLARSLGMRSVMEGVETTEQLAILASLGCDEVQGYIFSRPLLAVSVPFAQSHVSSLAHRFTELRAAYDGVSLPARSEKSKSAWELYGSN